MIFKIFLSTIVLSCITISTWGQAPDRGHIYFLRSTGYQGSAFGMPLFIDNAPACKVNNKKYSIHDVMPGKHTIKVQPSGKESKEKFEAIEINVEVGKDYYFQIILEKGWASQRLYLQEITESSAKRLIANLERDNCL